MTDSTRFARTGSVPGLTDTRRARHAAYEATLLLIKPAENTKRTDRTALALANSYAHLMALSEPLGKTQKQVAQDLGIHPSRFSQFLSLSKAPEEIQKGLLRRWTPGHLDSLRHSQSLRRQSHRHGRHADQVAPGPKQRPPPSDRRQAPRQSPDDRHGHRDPPHRHRPAPHH